MTKFDDMRFGLITGSRCSVLFPKRSAEVGQRSYAKELANSMYFRYYDEAKSWQLEHGNAAEELGIEYYKQYFDESIVAGHFAHKGFFGGTADALCDDHVVDIKAPTTLGNWLDVIYEPLKPEYYYQAQMYMYLFDKPKDVYAFYLLETDKMSNEGEVYPIPHDQRMITVDVYPEEGWVEELEKRAPAIIKMRDEYLYKLQLKFG